MTHYFASPGDLLMYMVKLLFSLHLNCVILECRNYQALWVN